MDKLLQQKLALLTNKYQLLIKNDKFQQCVEILQEIVNIKESAYGHDSLEFKDAIKKLCVNLNNSALVCLRKKKKAQALIYLKKAKLIAEDSQLKILTYNNLGFYYKKIGNNKAAYEYLIKVQELELEMGLSPKLAETKINLCATLSSLGRHKEALQHSMFSIILLQDDKLSKLLPKGTKESKVRGQEKMDQKMLTVAYNNLGVQFEHLNRDQQALKMYQKANELSIDCLDKNKQLAKRISKNYTSATQKFLKRKNNINKTMIIEKMIPQEHQDQISKIGQYSSKFEEICINKEVEIPIKDQFHRKMIPFNNPVAKNVLHYAPQRKNTENNSQPSIPQNNIAKSNDLLIPLDPKQQQPELKSQIVINSSNNQKNE